MLTREITVLQNDPTGEVDWPQPLSVVENVAGGTAEAAKNLIVLSALSRLSEVAELVRDANRAHRLRGLLVRSDVDPLWTAVFLDRANVRVLRNLLVHQGHEVPRRVLEAWASGAQETLIADATCVGDTLIVVGCDFERVEVPFSEVPALKAASQDVRRDFEVDEDGSFIYWPAADVHLDRRALTAYADPEVRRRQELEGLARDERFGGAVRALREAAGLTQSDIDGISERHVRRIEEGHRPKVATLKKLARACGLSLNDYLRELARELSQHARSSSKTQAT